MTRNTTYCLLAVAGMLLASCSSVRQIRPLEPGENAINVSVGGPVTKYIGEAQVPLPLLGIGYNRGLRPWLDIEGGVDITHALYKNFSGDVGANVRPFGARRWRPALIVSPKAHIATNFSTYFRLYPVLMLTAAWNPREGPFYPYLGIENWWELANTREDGLEQQNHWIIAPYAGLTYSKTRWQYQLEVRLYTPNLHNDLGRAPENWGLGDYGIFGFFVGIGRTFGGKD